MKHKDAFHKFLTIKSFLYYMVIPTFCYQLQFTKSKTIRVKWLIKKTVHFLLLSLASLFLFLEYTFPLLTQSPKYFRKGSINFLEIYPYVGL